MKAMPARINSTFFMQLILKRLTNVEQYSLAISSVNVKLSDIRKAYTTKEKTALPSSLLSAQRELHQASVHQNQK